MDCIFCKIINKEIPSYTVFENNEFLVFLDIAPLNKGHVLVVPKKHEGDIYNLDNDLYSEAFLLSKKLSPSLKQITNALRIGLVVEGFGVDHAHIHLVPLNKGRELNPERAYKASEEELKEMQLKISEEFKALL